MAEGEILEGFLCPICKADLGTALQLSSHFQDEHTEDQDVLKSLKDLLGKAKKRILKLDEELFANETDPSTNPARVPATNNIDAEPQTIGASRSHTQMFRSIRNNRLERYAAETNKLLIRLDKLLLDLPTDPVKRKAHEQAVVPWIDDHHVKLCPTCAKNFHLARRKHHCRLCGAIMCHDCTHFLQLTTAKKMTNPAFGHDSAGATGLPPSSAPGLAVLKRTNSNSSLNSVLSLVDTVTGEQHFRLCIHCKQLLDTREMLKESRNSKPIITQFYERLRSYMTEADQLSAMYTKMCHSLNSGESTYNLMDAQILRVKVLKLAENIDSLSNKICVLGTKDIDNVPRGKVLKLQQMIRSAATSYLKDQLIVLPALPTESQLAALQQRRKQEVTDRILQEKRQILEARQRACLGEMRMVRKSQSPRSSSPSSHKATARVTSDTGWGPEAAQLFESEDPMIQQMNIIRNYIKQARSAHKYDEVSTLEENLHELRDEYFRQQQSGEK